MSIDYKRAKKSATVARKQQRAVKSSGTACATCEGLRMVIRSTYVPGYGRYMPITFPCRACHPSSVPMIDNKTMSAGRVSW